MNRFKNVGFFYVFVFLLSLVALLCLVSWLLIIMYVCVLVTFRDCLKIRFFTMLCLLCMLLNRVWSQLIPPSVAYDSFLTRLHSCPFMFIPKCFLTRLHQIIPLGMWLLQCSNDLVLVLMQEEDLNMDNVYYSEMKDAGFFDPDWE